MSALLDDLYEYMSNQMDGENATGEEETGKAFEIDTQEKAIWALRKIARIEARRAEAIATAKIEVERIQAWLTGQEEKANRERSYFDSLLRDYANRLREADPKFKTLKLPNGSIGLRKQQPEFIYAEETILPWAKENLLDAVQIKESISKTVVKNYIKETGEVVPGVTIEPRPDKFVVEVE